MKFSKVSNEVFTTHVYFHRITFLPLEYCTNFAYIRFRLRFALTIKMNRKITYAAVYSD